MAEFLHHITLTSMDLILIADALEILDPLDEEGEEDGMRTNQCLELAGRFRARVAMTSQGDRHEVDTQS